MTDTTLQSHFTKRNTDNTSGRHGAKVACPILSVPDNYSAVIPEKPRKTELLVTSFDTILTVSPGGSSSLRRTPPTPPVRCGHIAGGGGRARHFPQRPGKSWSPQTLPRARGIPSPSPCFPRVRGASLPNLTPQQLAPRPRALHPAPPASTWGSLPPLDPAAGARPHPSQLPLRASAPSWRPTLPPQALPSGRQPLYARGSAGTATQPTPSVVTPAVTPPVPLPGARHYAHARGRAPPGSDPPVPGPSRRSALTPAPQHCPGSAAGSSPAWTPWWILLPPPLCAAGPDPQRRSAARRAPPRRRRSRARAADGAAAHAREEGVAGGLRAAAVGFRRQRRPARSGRGRLAAATGRSCRAAQPLRDGGGRKGVALGCSAAAGAGLGVSCHSRRAGGCWSLARSPFLF